MKTQLVTYVLHSQDGNVEPVEVDGVKYEANPDKPEEALLDDKGEKVPFKEPEAPAETEDEKTAREAKEKEAQKIGEMSLEELVKTNPLVAKAISAGKTAEEALAQAEIDAKKAITDKAEKDGKWQELAVEREGEIKILKDTLGQKDEVLTKYKGSVTTILKEIESTIPDDKKGLIPDSFSPRQRLEYIVKNAKLLGAKSISNVGDQKPVESDEGTTLTDEMKLATEIDELQKKENKTPIELDLLFEKAKKLKAIRAGKKD